MAVFEPVVRIERTGAIAHIAFDRPAKRNAVNDAAIDAPRDFFAAPPDGVRAVVLSGAGGHFSAGSTSASRCSGRRRQCGGRCCSSGRRIIRLLEEERRWSTETLA